MRRVGILIALLALTFAALAAQQPSKAVDPRVGLKPGNTDAGVAASHIELLSHLPRPEGFDDSDGRWGLNFVNSDLAFQGSAADSRQLHRPELLRRRRTRGNQTCACP
jgi:hypothetical protein